MKKTKRKVFIILSLFSAFAISCASLLFIYSVRTLLWEKSVTDIIEVTEQGRHTIDIYLEKDFDELTIFSNELRKMDSHDQAGIQSIIAIFEGEDSALYCSNLDSGVTYATKAQNIPLLNEEEKQQFTSLEGQGIREPYYDGYSGVRSIAVYQSFTFADGVIGLAQKTHPIQSIIDRYSLSFYNNTGFSYIIDTQGNVLIRSMHKNSNRTFVNLFDIIDVENNDPALLSNLQEGLQNNKSGAIQLQYQKEDYIFAFVPMIHGNQWYVVSIIPTSAIMEQANKIINHTLFLCLLILGCMAMLGYFYHRSNQKSTKQIQELAYYDKLSGLYRYEKFLIDGEARLHAGQGSIAVLYIDVMGFKLINDIEGYSYGDRVLKHIANVMQNVHVGNPLCCRVSGDDFIYMCNYTSRDQIEVLAQQMISEATKGLNDNKPVNVRIGICLQEDTIDVKHINGIIDRARLAQTSIKENSKMRYTFYNKEMRETLIRDAEMEASMRKALRDGEFIYFIQPKYSLDGKKILGGEALVRWKKSENEFISPAMFIPLFERNGFIKQVDEYVFTSVCQDIKKRMQAHLPLVPISVNVSRIHLYDEGFVDAYIKIKEMYEIPDNIIELELTESILLENTKDIFLILKRLKDHGFRCSIDDFGSGYSSLNTLKDLPFDVVKLDKVFFDQSEHVDRNRVILRSMIAMAKELSMKVVAEGIEKQDQLQMLDHTGCDMIQGYIYSKPCFVSSFYEQLDALHT